MPRISSQSRASAAAASVGSPPVPYHSGRPRRTSRMLALASLVLLAVATGHVQATSHPTPAARSELGIVGLQTRHLDPAHWVARLGADADIPYLDPTAIAALNARLVAEDDSVRDMAGFPRTLEGAAIRAWIEKASARPSADRYDAAGRRLDAADFAALERSLALEAIPAEATPQPGLVVERAALRAFPTRERVFSRPGDLDIDRFQESALFPGDAVAVLHTSADGAWAFVASDRYLAWMERDKLATGTAAEIDAWRTRTPALFVTGATARTVFNPERPDVSDLQLDMGVRVPRAVLPRDALVHGQHPAFGHAIELPARREDGTLAFVPALLPRTADVADAPLPLTPANLIRQSFKFLGERYGWGHDFNARDCSGFVAEIYRSMGLDMPRNTSDQSVSPAFDKTLFDADTDSAAREAAVAALQIGDLVYIPGHVMMVIGHEDGMTYVIHDTAGFGYTGADGDYVRVPVYGVAVTPLEPLMSDAGTSTIDRITSIVRLR